MINKDSIFIYGGGGHGKVILDIIQSAYGTECIAGVFDDDPQKKGQLFYGTKIIGSMQEYENSINQLVLAIGDNNIRKIKASLCDNLVNSYPVLIDPTAAISKSAQIGDGTVLMPGAHVNADALIGKHCIINTGATIEHDCTIHDFAHIAPGVVLTGAVEVGSLTLVGANTTVVPGVKIGQNCLVAAGTVVTKDIPDNALVRGNPGRVIKIKD